MRKGAARLLRIEGTSIQMTRGDTIRFAAVLEGRELPDGTTAVFAVKKQAWRRGEALIEKTIPVIMNKVNVMLDKDETELESGHYVWDVRIRETSEGGEYRFTPMAYGGIDVLEAIGDG